MRTILAKPKAWRSEEYRAFIREHLCLKCGVAFTVAHHEGFGEQGVGIKAPDSYCVPLCEACHDKVHNIGYLTFWQAIDVKKKMIEYLTEFLMRKEGYNGF